MCPLIMVLLSSFIKLIKVWIVKFSYKLIILSQTNEENITPFGSPGLAVVMLVCLLMDLSQQYI